MTQNQRTILIIDDSPEDREAYRRYLLADNRSTYTILESEYGENGLELCRLVKPDLILLDYLLPDIDGLEFLTQLKTQNGTINIPVVMITGQGNESVAVQAMKSGASDYLIKGNTTPESLRFTIHNVIENAHLRQQQLEQSEERFRESQRFIQQITDTTPGLLYLYDLVEQRNVYVNRQIVEVLGYTPEQIQAMGGGLLQQLMHPDDLPRMAKLFKRFDSVADGEIIASEYRMQHINGEWRWFFSQDTMFSRTANGLAQQILGTAIDISDRKQAEEKLRLSNERFELAAAAVNCLIYDWDIEKNTVERTEGLTQILGYSLQEAEPTRDWWNERIHPDDFQRVREQVAATLAKGDRYVAEYRVRNKDNQYLYVLDQGLVVRDAQGRPVRAVGSTTDISDRKRAEAERVRFLELEQAARAAAEAANRAKDDFVAMVSHGLRAPLNAILGWAQLLRNRNQSEAIIERALETIERNAKSQAKLIEDLLDVSRMIQGKLEIHICPVELIPLIEAAISTAYPTANAKGVRLESILALSVETISGDPNRLQQILGNVLSNAINFTPEGGRVEVRLETVNAYAQIIVSDTGCGIAAEFLPYVFDRFRQANSNSRKGGLGLGLAIARHLIELHGGSIQVESPGVGQGATFTIKLPLIDSEYSLQDKN